MAEQPLSDPPAVAADEVETSIDRAWAAAGAAPSDVEAAQFLDVVLTEMLICPVWEETFEDGPNEDDGPDGIAPKMLELEGVETLLLFDTEERLAAFVEEPTSFVALPGRAFFEMMAAEGAQIALNLDVAPSSTVFAPESVAAVAEIIDSAEEEIVFDPATPLDISAPADVSEEALTALSTRLAASTALAEAWLFDLRIVDETAPQPPHRVLVLVSAADDDEALATLDQLGRDAARAAAAADPDGLTVETTLLPADDPILARARETGFGLHTRAD